MSLAPGVRVGPFEVVSRLGAGGMGEVYLARDARLGREVALKTLPEAFTRDAKRRARLEREARLLASLSHPNVAALFGVEDSDGTPVLVMELVSGESLAERLLRGALPVRDALDVVRQVAEGLEAAHRKGIIHRDLKPANVKPTTEGRVKVLDFGLAKALSATLVDDPLQAETASRGETGTGAVMGTTAYMSPEQARGDELDERTDIWSFGCLLYECLTGRRAFAGATASDTLAAVLEHAPDWSALPAATPALGRSLLRLCLQKDRARRLQNITDARLQIEEALAAPAEETSTGVAAAKPSARRRWLALVAASLVGAAVAAALAAWLGKSTPSRETIRLVAELPPETHLAGASDLERLVGGNRPSRTAFALSRDGTLLAFSAAKSGGRSQVYLRRFDQAQATAVPGTEGADGPFFSPNGAWLGFWAGGALYKVAIDGGLPVKLCESLIPVGASWGAKGSIVFGRLGEGLWQVSAEGGTPRPLTTPDRALGEEHLLPHFLPDGRVVLFTVVRGLRGWAQAQIVLQDLESGERRVLVERGADARYIASGHLLYGAAGVLMAAPFDLQGKQVVGAAVPVIKDVMQATNSQNDVLETSALQLQASESGTLVYALGGPHPSEERSFLWLDRAGAVEPLDIPAGPYRFPRVSPDGTRIAFVKDEAGGAIWVYELSRRQRSRLTFEGDAQAPVWSPDGRRVAFGLVSDRSGPRVFAIEADGSGDLKLLVTGLGVVLPSSWSPDGRFLAATRWQGGTDHDIWTISVDGTSSAQPFLNTRFAERYPALSPDGSWLAYASDESGRNEVYVRPYPGPGPRRQISSNGGSAPVWAASGRELFYSQWAGREPALMDFMTVGVATSPTFHATTPRLLFRRSISFTDPIRNFDLTPDGRRFLVLTLGVAPDQRVTRLNVVLNWFEELKRRVAANPGSRP